MNDGLVKNTLVFSFPAGAAGPSLVELARFVKDFDADTSTMESSYKISEERCVYIKFKTMDFMKDALIQNPEFQVFHFSNGTTAKVKMSVAGSYTKYVRIFDLPPEISDSDISAVLGKYGSVKRMVKEKFPAEFELDMFTGVRGVYIDIKKEIPASLFFLNRRGRIYYEGLKQKCFLCKEEGHQKAGCPQNKSKKEVEKKSVSNGSDGSGKSSGNSSGGSGGSGGISGKSGNRVGGSGGNGGSVGSDSSVESSGDGDQANLGGEMSYAGALSGSGNDHPVENPVLQMVKLVSTRNAGGSTSASSGGNTAMDVEAVAMKRQLAAEESTGTDEDGFIKVEEKGRSRTRRARLTVNPLEVIATVPNASGESKKSSRHASK